MKKGFTLLELIVVIIILGILATLGMQQYFRVVEKSRSAEAKQVIGQIREAAAAIYTDTSSLTGLAAANFGIGTLLGNIPSAPRSSNYFTYTATGSGASSLTITATRCTGTNGRQPGFSSAATITLTADLGSAASDAWAYDPAYQ